MSKQVDVKCNDYGRLATIPLDEFSMTCTECGGLNLPIEAIPADELDALRQRAEATAAERDAARAQEGALREALAFYADTANYRGDGWMSEVDADHWGDRARAALAADATQAGERWRAMRRVCEAAREYRAVCGPGAQDMARTGAERHWRRELSERLAALAALGGESGE